MVMQFDDVDRGRPRPDQSAARTLIPEDFDGLEPASGSDGSRAGCNALCTWDDERLVMAMRFSEIAAANDNDPAGLVARSGGTSSRAGDPRHQAWEAKTEKKSLTDGRLIVGLVFWALAILGGILHLAANNLGVLVLEAFGAWIGLAV